MPLEDFRSQAIFGDRLWGDRLMRFVYMDEAGTSANEPITVVVGLIVDADAQLMDAEAAAREVIGGVPANFRDGFLFHADDVWNNKKYRADWSLADRLSFLKRMMALPRRLKMPIAYGLVRRTAGPSLINKLSPAQSDHVMAFGYCVARADKYIRERAGAKEIGSIVAEDVPEMRRFLKAAVDAWRKHTFVTPPGGVLPTVQEKQLGYVTQETEMRVSRIRSSILFVGKGEDPVTQIADAVAFGFRRYLGELDFGMEFAQAIFGPKPQPLADFAGPCSMGTYRWNP